MTALSPAASPSYDVRLVSIGGVTVATASGRLRSLTLADPSANILPETSASSDRVYFLDGDRQLNWLKPDGSTGPVSQLGGSTTEESAFSVSPDNKQIAIADFNLGPQRSFSYTLTVAAIDGTNPKVVSRASGNAGTAGVEWPVGWHGTAIVLQRGLLFNQYAFGYGSMSGFRLVDSATGTELATICGDNEEVWSPLEPSGAICVGIGKYVVQGLDGKSTYSTTQCAPWSPALAPDGSRWAARPTVGSGSGCSNTNDPVTLYSVGGGSTSTGVAGSPWGWADDQHVVVDQQSPVEPVTTPFKLVDIRDGTATNTTVVGRFVGVMPARLS